MAKIPNLHDLPKTEKSGWPWNVIPESELMHTHMNWPKISIVTPSYNQAQFLEETIRSVLLQGYPNLEYIVIDGNSNDDSVEIIKKYKPWLTYWVSEPDRGQSHAINKGFDLSSGDIMAWINSDDYYAPNAFFKVALTFMQSQSFWVAGIVHKVDAQGKVLHLGRKYIEKMEDWYVGSLYLQQGVFWRRKLWLSAGKIDETLQYSFDYDLLLRFVQQQSFATWIDAHLANFRIHSDSKTSLAQLKFMQERKKIYKRYPTVGMGKKERINIILKRQERKSRIFMGMHGSRPALELLARIFLATPWYFFRPSFLYWIKVKLLSNR